MSILGVDVGYYSTKIYSRNGRDIFKSTVQEGTTDFNKSITIEYGDKEYTIGESTGAVSTKLNKIHDETFRLCLFTAIAKSMEVLVDPNVKLITGLPVQYYKEQKNSLIESLKGLKVTMVYMDRPKSFTITDVLVFPQSAGLFVVEPEKFKGDNIICDIGGMTVDVSYFRDLTMLKSRTYEMGMHKLNDKIVQEIKSRYGVSYDPIKAENIIKDRFIIKDGNRVDVTTLLNTIMKQHSKEIIDTVTLGLAEYETSVRHFIGGGSYTLKDYLPSTIKEDDVYTNAKAYYMIGVSKFESKEKS